MSFISVASGSSLASVGPRVAWCSRLSRAAVCSCGLRRQGAYPNEVVHGQPEDKHPADACDAAMAHFAQQADLLEPAENLFDALALPLAHPIAVVARGAAIDRTRTLRGVLRHVRGHGEPAQAVHEIPRVIAFVRPQRRAGR